MYIYTCVSACIRKETFTRLSLVHNTVRRVRWLYIIGTDGKGTRRDKKSSNKSSHRCNLFFGTCTIRDCAFIREIKKTKIYVANGKNVGTRKNIEFTSWKNKQVDLFSSLLNTASKKKRNVTHDWKKNNYRCVWREKKSFSFSLSCWNVGWRGLESFGIVFIMFFISRSALVQSFVLRFSGGSTFFVIFFPHSFYNKKRKRFIVDEKRGRWYSKRWMIGGKPEQYRYRCYSTCRWILLSDWSLCNWLLYPILHLGDCTKADAGERRNPHLAPRPFSPISVFPNTRIHSKPIDLFFCYIIDYLPITTRFIDRGPPINQRVKIQSYMIARLWFRMRVMPRSCPRTLRDRVSWYTEFSP